MKYFLLALVTGVSLFFAVRVRAGQESELLEIQSTETIADKYAPKPVSASDQTIAVRNNNPMNIRATSDNWEGLASPRTANGFFNFTLPEYGFRAARKIILGAYANRGVRSVSQIISTWAPKSENNTAAYIAFVEKDSGLRGSTLININNLRPLLVSMAKMESGKYWPSSVIDRSFQL